MEKDIDKIPKNQDTDIIIRVDDFGGRRGITIREFVRGERYTGFTKAGTRIPAEHFKAFKQAINSIDEKELMEAAVEGGMQKGLNAGSGVQEFGAGKSDVKEKVKKAKPKAEEDEDEDIGGEF